MSPEHLQWLALGLLLLFAICVAGIVAYCGSRYEHWRNLRKDALPEPAADERMWTEAWKRSMKNTKTEVV